MASSQMWLNLPLVLIIYINPQYHYTISHLGMTTAVIVAGKEGIRVAGQGGEKPWW